MNRQHSRELEVVSSETSVDYSTSTPAGRPRTGSYMGTVDGSETDYPDNNLVELATLVLPSHANQAGLEVGDGENVVLEANQETVENIAAANAYTSSMIVSAVVDLEVLSDLVGLTEQEFIRDLYSEVAENRVFEGDDKNDNRKDDEGHGHSTTTTESRPAIGEGEEQPLLPMSGGDDTDDIMSDRVTLTADPFIETLAETLHETVGDGGDTQNDVVLHLPTISEGSPLKSTDGTVVEEQPVVSDVEAGEIVDTATTTYEASASKVDEEQHVGHDAFLLSIPNRANDGTLEDHFVLALPEIRPDDSVSVMSPASTVSHASHYTFPTLQKAFSILSDVMDLPSDVVNIQLLAQMDPADDASFKQPTVISADSTIPPEPQLHLDLVVQRQVPIIGYVILISGLVALASVGAALDLQHGASTTLKTLWRQLCTSLILSPFVLKSLVTEGIPSLTRQQWLMLPLAGAAYAYMCLAFVVALEMTTLANAFVLSNMASLVIIVGRSVMGLPILKAEGIGAVLGFVGAAICANDATKTMARLGELGGISTSTAGNAMLGNIVALSASFGTAAYLLFAKSLRSSVDVFVFMFSVMSLGSVWLIVYMIVLGEQFSWGMDPNFGLFGWLNTQSDRLPLELFMAVVCNCMGTTGYIAVLKYFEPIVPSSVMLMEPVVGSLLGTLAGTAPLPGLQTWIGDSIVAGGTFLVIWSGSKKTEKIEATEALRLTTGDDGSTIASFKGSLNPRKPSAKGDDPTTKVVWD